MMLRAELPVQRNSTLKGLAHVMSSGFTTLFGARSLHAAAIHRALSGGQKGFPLHALRIFDPIFLAFGIAAGGLALH